MNGAYTEIEAQFDKLGIHVRRNWLSQCIETHSDFLLQNHSFSFEKLQMACFASFLNSDLNVIGSGTLPPNLHSTRNQLVKGTFVLQIDEIIDIGVAARERFEERNAGKGGRCLKLSMTDGVQRLVGFEYQPINALNVLMPAGIKVAIRDVYVRNGIFFLIPSNLTVLGGEVASLEDAKMKVLTVWNEPPRGNRRLGGEVTRPLLERAMHAAWKEEEGEGEGEEERTDNLFDDSNNHHVSASANELRSDHERVSSNQMRFHSSSSDRNILNPNLNQVRVNEVDETEEEDEKEEKERYLKEKKEREAKELPLMENRRREMEELEKEDRETVIQSHNSVNENERIRMHPSSFMERKDEEGKGIRGRVIEDMEEEDEHQNRVRRYNEGEGTSTSGNEGMERKREMGRKEGNECELNVLNIEIENDDYKNVFVYLKELMCYGNEFESKRSGSFYVKCISVSVKEFVFKNSEFFHLIIYIDDGSYMTQAKVHHDIVKGFLKCSPREVESSLTKTDSVSKTIKQSLREMQGFLALFEGIVLLSFTEEDMPIITEMMSGAETINCRNVLHRVKMKMKTKIDDVETIELSE